jgi:hypothetical protein
VVRGRHKWGGKEPGCGINEREREPVSGRTAPFLSLLLLVEISHLHFGSRPSIICMVINYIGSGIEAKARKCLAL